MCVAIQFQGKVYRPSRPIRVVADRSITDRVWTGCAREEMLEWWKKRGARLADLHAEAFAERPDRGGSLVWGDVPPGLVVCALLDPIPGPGREHVKVVTRAATPEEAEHFGHGRIPLLVRPHFPEIIPSSGAPQPVPAQLDWFEG